MDQQVSVFRKQWESYQKIIHGNHLNHLDVLAAINSILTGDATIRCEKVLDLGCGDCWLPFKLASEGALPNLKNFVGVDLTQEALDIAAATNPFQNNQSVIVTLKQQDIYQFLQQSSESFDLITTSYALHHFLPVEKPSVVHEIAKRLAPGGIFIWADVFNSVPNSTRDETMSRWKPRFLGIDSLTPEESAPLWEHVSTYDYPESLERMGLMMGESGLVDIEVVYVEEGEGAYSVVMCARKQDQLI